MKKIASQSIQNAVALAIAHSNELDQITEGWTQVKQVVFMKKKLSVDARAAIAQAEPTLVFWETAGTPHNRPECGFEDNVEEVVLAFPRI